MDPSTTIPLLAFTLADFRVSDLLDMYLKVAFIQIHTPAVAQSDIKHYIFLLQTLLFLPCYARPAATT